MKVRTFVPLLIVLTAAFPGLSHESSAQVVGTSTSTAVPTNTPLPLTPLDKLNPLCGLATPIVIKVCTPVPTTATPILPQKLLTVSGGLPGPAGTTMYKVSVSAIVPGFVALATVQPNGVCTLQEPINVYVLGGDGNAVLTAIDPARPLAQTGQSISVRVSRKTGTARILLEVAHTDKILSGVTVKAVYPVEGIERLVNVIPPAPATPTATGGPTATVGPPTVTTSPPTSVVLPTVALSQIANECVVPTTIPSTATSPTPTPRPGITFVP